MRRIAVPESIAHQRGNSWGTMPDRHWRKVAGKMSRGSARGFESAHDAPSEPGRRRSCPGRCLALLLALLTAAACTQGGERQPTLEAPAQAPSTPSSAPMVTLIGGRQVSLEEVENIKVAVRKYFDAFSEADFKGLETHSTGELKALANWQRILNKGFQGLGFLKPAAARFDSMTVVSVEGDTATVEIKGQLNETASIIDRTNTVHDKLISTDISGAVALVRETTWRVANFHRGGRWAGEQIYTKVRGQQTSQGVVVKVIGVDLRPKGTVLIMEVRNTTGLTAGAGSPVLREASGKQQQIALDENIVVVEVGRRSKAVAGLFYLKSLRPTTKKFNLLVNVNLGCDPVCNVATSMNLPVQLLR